MCAIRPTVSHSSILNCFALVGAALPKWQPLFPEGPAAAILGEGDNVVPLSPRKASGLAMGPLQSQPAVLQMETEVVHFSLPNPTLKVVNSEVSAAGSPTLLPGRLLPSPHRQNLQHWSVVTLTTVRQCGVGTTAMTLSTTGVGPTPALPPHRVP